MPKMGISVDETTRHLLRKHGGERHIGVLIGKMIRDFDKEETFGLPAIRQRLDRIENLVLHLAVHIPRESCHRFHGKVATDSAVNLPSIPVESCH